MAQWMVHGQTELNMASLDSRRFGAWANKEYCITKGIESYEIMYTERYMDTPEKNPSGYAKASLLDKVQNLKGDLLLIHGADDDVVVPQNSIDLLKRLLPYGIDINAKNNDGYTALHIAAMRADNEDLLRYLLSQGADKKIKTEFEETAFSLALENELLQKKNIKFLE